jgi:5'-nucleotidase
MRILLTNDDGIHAEGLTCLRRIAEALAGGPENVWVCAPETEQSGASRGITLAVPMRVRQIAEREWAVSGTPTDCVLLAVNDLMSEKPDLVLSGVNRGQNMGEDVTLSGTVAGALQGRALGIPSIALSQALYIFQESRRAPYETAEAHGPGVIKRLLQLGWPSDVIINVNFPDAAPEDVTEIEVTTQGVRDAQHMHAERRTDLRGKDYYWMGFRGQMSNPPEGTDLRAIYEGRISVTPLHIDLTHMQTVNALRKVLGGPPPKLHTDKTEA